MVILAGLGMKPGDWMCSSCGDHQFAKNTECRKCGAARSGGGGWGAKGKRAGDWFCPNCNDLQYADNAKCRKCSTPNPDPEGCKAAKEAGIAAGHGGQEMKPGDWFCPGCNDLQFAKNKKCRKCSTPNPDPQGSLAAAEASGNFKNNSAERKPGDWTCSNCGDHQFAKNMACRVCGTPNMQGMMGGGGGKGGGGKGGQNGMVAIPQNMLMMMMNAMGGGGGNMMNMMGNMGGGKGGGKGGKGKGKNNGCKWCAKGECWGCNRSSPF